MSLSPAADEKKGGLLSRDRPSGSDMGSLEGLRALWGGGGENSVGVLLQSLSFFFFAALFLLSSKTQTCSKVSSLLHTNKFVRHFIVL